AGAGRRQAAHAVRVQGSRTDGGTANRRRGPSGVGQVSRGMPAGVGRRRREEGREFVRAVYNRSVIRHRFAVAGFGVATAISLVLVAIRAAPAARTECFLLYEVGVGQIRREPSSGCATRVTPASTFKIPHALAGLDAGGPEGPDTRIAYDGAPVRFESWRHDHTLASAMHSSVLWYFQRVATRRGGGREGESLRKFDYGNQDTSSGLTTFWLGGSLRISPDEQQAFLLKLYHDALPVSA